MSGNRRTSSSGGRRPPLRTRQRNGYAEFYDERSQTWRSTHRRTLEKRIGEHNLEGKQVHHIDGDKTNNRISNLVALTPRMHGRIASKPDACFRCGHTGHFVKDCYATSDYQGAPLPRR